MKIVDDEVMSQHITRLVEDEIAAWDTTAAPDAAHLEHFQQRRVRKPRPITVNFSGGITQTCWSVTRSDGSYQVVYLPTAGYFSLCVASDFGPLDIGVHGPAIKCFGAV
ncbi:hypothetical protein [Mesobacterium pallidum]|uniref:hypothetical protein n=1 Tax=Mesobacterium pallidum TaxID=2872037 RepID=UPI001EE1927E|nr:hypothetical protein [Mesobacterium pallidum]